MQWTVMWWIFYADVMYQLGFTVRINRFEGVCEKFSYFYTPWKFEFFTTVNFCELFPSSSTLFRILFSPPLPWHKKNLISSHSRCLWYAWKRNEGKLCKNKKNFSILFKPYTSVSICTYINVKIYVCMHGWNEAFGVLQ